MKIFIVFALFVAATSALIIPAPALGYSAYGLNAGLPLVSGVRTLGYAAPLATRVVAPISTVGLSAYSPIVSRPIVAPVAAYGIRAVPLVSSAIAPSVYGTGLLNGGFLAKKV